LADLAESLDKSAASLKLSRGESDAVLKQIYKETGFDGKATVTSKKAIDAILADGGTGMARGMGAVGGDRTAGLKQFQSGDYFTGNGIYGNGTYVVHSGKYGPNGEFIGGNSKKTNQDALDAIATRNSYVKPSGVAMRGALKPTASIISQDNLIKAQTSFKGDLEKWAADKEAVISA
jgi:hypothetical protein